MLTTIMLPWWGWVYLLLTLAVFVAGFFSEERLDLDELVGSSLSLFSICVFVIGFFNPQVVAFFGVLLVPMAGIGIYWEFIRANEETRRAEEELSREPDLDDGERALLLNVAVGFNALIVVPGYMVGVVLCFNMLGIA